jgi:hypothetical protein
MNLSTYAAVLLAALAAAAADPVWESRVETILKSNCTACHDAQKRTSGFSVASREDVLGGGARRGPAVKPGEAASSPLIKHLKGELEPRMPAGLPALPAAQIEQIASWINGLKLSEVAARDQKWWAYEKAVKPAGPAVKNQAWGRTGIDRFILAKLDAKGLEPSAEAPRAALLRRAYLDFTGLPPAHAEEREFLRDTSPDAYEKLIERLLASPAFGERWARHWLDLARFADTQGFEADRENYHMWRYRDYVIQSFNQDKPYDRFVIEQIAGDEIPGAGAEQQIATGFLRLTPRYQLTNAQELRQLILDEITGTVGSVFLGLTLKCAQCHDHKYDPIPQKDFYRLQAFFAPIEMTETPAGFTHPALKARMEAATKEAARKLDEAQRRFDDYQRELLAKLEASGVKLPPGTEAARANDVLDADAVGAATFIRRTTPRVVELERRIGRAIANGVVPNLADNTFTLDEKKKYLDLLSYVDGTRGGRDMGVHQRELRRYRPAAHVVRNMPNDSGRAAFPVTFVRLNGEFSRPGEWVKPGFLSAITGNQEPAPLVSDQFGNVRAWRLPLARWIASPDNPFTARVIANRVWQHLMGSPIVGTPSDFGRNGARPTHPELLDYLATRLVEQKWSVKALIREIAASSVYRQSSAGTAVNEQKVDPENGLYWRQNRKRMEGEVLRDSILKSSGLLNSERFGPGVMIKLPEGVRERMTIKNFPSWIPVDGHASRVRSIYVFQRRQLEVPFLATMDAPVFQNSCERRAVSTTAVQALTLMNDELITEAASHLAAQTIKQAAADPGEQVAIVFRSILTRDPGKDEVEQSLAFLRREGSDGLAGLCRVLFNTNEFVYVD